MKQNHFESTVFENQPGLQFDCTMRKYTFSPNATKMQQKCFDDASPNNSTEVSGANILTMKPGRTMSTSEYIFSRPLQMDVEEIRPIFVNLTQGEVFRRYSERSFNTEVQSLLKEMILD